jgi:predicted metal-dependent enzyme (double-stranded beta helix superfamily)
LRLEVSGKAGDQGSIPAAGKPGLPAARRFAEEVRALYAKGLKETELWQRIAAAMRNLLRDPALRQRAQSWPNTIEGAGVAANLLLYEDADYGFVFNATVRKANTVSNVHDHGDVWTLYGLIEGRETMHRYARHERADAGTDGGAAPFDLVSRRTLEPGDIDIVPPGGIHQEHAGEERSIAFIVRGRRPGTFPQYQYDLASGAVSVTSGPRQLVQPL